MPITRRSQQPPGASDATTLADILERVLDKGVVIAGDIKVKLVEIELLTIQVRLVVCSVDKAVEMGMDWWTHEPSLLGGERPAIAADPAAAALQERMLTQLERMEARLAALEGPPIEAISPGPPRSPR